MKPLAFALTLYIPLTSFAFSAPAASDSLYDLFPLAPTLHYTYDYESHGSGYDEINSSGSRDSGTVEYVILDSSAAGDTAILWTIEELVTIHRWETQFIPLLDTNY